MQESRKGQLITPTDLWAQAQGYKICLDCGMVGKAFVLLAHNCPVYPDDPYEELKKRLLSK